MSPENDVVPPPNKSEILIKIGQSLVEQRKARGLTQDKVALALKIRLAFVKAMEEGKWSELPGDVYARGFIGRYANLVGLDPKALLAPYFEKVGQPDRPVRATEASAPASREMPRSALVWGGVALVVVAGLIKVIVSDHKNTRPAVAPAPKQAPVSVSTAQVVAVNPAAPLVEHTLDVYSPFPLWLSVKSETKAFEGFLPQGTTWSWKGDGNFNIRLGHTQEVAMVFDGRPVSLGENQKRVNLPSEN